jgi:hypothetical protein
MRYLSLFPFPSDPSDELVIDLHKPDKADVSYAIELLSLSVDHAYQSHFKSLLKAKFPRTSDHLDSSKSRQIKTEFAPKRLTADEAICLLQGLKRRGKDKARRKIHPNSLCNLRPAARFTPQNHPTKPCLLSEQQVVQATQLRINGCSWRTVGDHLGVNAETVRSTLRRRGIHAPNKGSISSEIQGKKVPAEG